ncbi:Transcription repressor like [Quillaja saponaria]|uniref:Transcription repressor n=1 Tax=Quillaja saponaria TaxID=32244 RepID=A0AAD7PLF0_QUISA|nr:Transcription repressor like [Quillaja saponaria]
MGNYRFKLSDMMPNAWFYKLKDMSIARKLNMSRAMKTKVTSPTTSQRSHLSQPRHSFYFSIEPNTDGKLFNSSIKPKASDTHFPDSPRRSSMRRARRRTIYKPSPSVVSSSVSAGPATLNNEWTKQNQVQSPDHFVSSIESSSKSDFHEYLSSESDCDTNSDVHDLFHELASCNNRVSSSTTDYIIDVNNESFTRNSEKLDEFDISSELELPPILTTPAKYDDKAIEVTKLRSSSKLKEIQGHRSVSIKNSKEGSIGRTQIERRRSPQVRKPSANSTGIRLKANSPKLASRKIQTNGRKSVSSSACKGSRNRSFPEGFAIVKSSVDPQRDFRESMVEMIVENNIRSSKDLEDLLACYLSLNSNIYHDLIVKAFEQIWFDIADHKM